MACHGADRYYTLVGATTDCQKVTQVRTYRVSGCRIRSLYPVVHGSLRLAGHRTIGRLDRRMTDSFDGNPLHDASYRGELGRADAGSCSQRLLRLDSRDPEFWFADFEWDDLGDLDGRDVPHLQCHQGAETAAFAQRGARAVGLDLSGAPNAQARQSPSARACPSSTCRPTCSMRSTPWADAVSTWCTPARARWSTFPTWSGGRASSLTYCALRVLYVVALQPRRTGQRSSPRRTTHHHPARDRPGTVAALAPDASYRARLVPAARPGATRAAALRPTRGRTGCRPHTRT